MAWNHWRSGLRVPWKRAPAVMDDWCPHPLQCIKPRWVSHASPDKHRGQRKPDGQRTLMRYCRLLSSVANHRSNSPSVRGYSESTTSVRYPWESLEARGYVEVFYTMAASGKVKRMRQNRRVRVAPCDARGNVKGEWAEGSARSLQDEGARQADRMLDDKYGWQRSLIRLLTRLRRRPRAAYAIRLA